MNAHKVSCPHQLQWDVMMDMNEIIRNLWHVILSEAKDLRADIMAYLANEILRFAQDDISPLIF